MRGKVKVELGLAAGHGIIPAGAGKSEVTEGGKAKGGDHPRGCGEKSPIKRGKDS